MLFLILNIIVEITFGLPIHNITHEVKIYIEVDSVSKGFIHFGLFGLDAPKSVK